MKMTINKEQRLYVYQCGAGVSCIGFEYAEKQIKAVSQWIGFKSSKKRLGTLGHYKLYQEAMEAGREYHNRTMERCCAGLTPQLVGAEGKRVEVVDSYGEKRRFQVGKSTGWMPCHLEIARRNSSGGPAVMGTPFKSIRFV